MAAAVLRTQHSVSAKRQALLAREELQSSVAVSGDEPLSILARQLRVPKEKLRGADRFGLEIGTFSVLDETLDRLGEKLLSQQRKALRPLELENI